MSRRRQRAPLRKYCDWPSRLATRLTEISLYLAYSPTTRPSELSKISSTCAVPTGLRPPEPEKITSLSASPRRRLAALSPMTQRIASMMLDLPQPFGPTMPVMFVGKCRTVGSTKDLNPESLIVVRRIGVFLGIRSVRRPLRCDAGRLALRCARPQRSEILRSTGRVDQAEQKAGDLREPATGPRLYHPHAHPRVHLPVPEDRPAGLRRNA